MKIGIVSVLRDEGAHLKEWIAFHRAMGVTHFFLFSHDCKDNTSEILKADKGVYTEDLKYTGGSELRIVASKIIAPKVKELDWLGYIDGDELVVPLQDDTLTKFFARIHPAFHGLCFNWKVFGERDRAGTSQLEISRCSTSLYSMNRGFKHFYRPGSEVRPWFGVHVPPTDMRCTLLDATWPVNLKGDESRLDRVSHNFVQINHYRWKSEAEWLARKEAGYTYCAPRAKDRGVLTIEEWRKGTNFARDFRAQGLAILRGVVRSPFR